MKTLLETSTSQSRFCGGVIWKLRSLYFNLNAGSQWSSNFKERISFCKKAHVLVGRKHETIPSILEIKKRWKNSKFVQICIKLPQTLWEFKYEIPTYLPTVQQNQFNTIKRYCSLKYSRFLLFGIHLQLNLDAVLNSLYYQTIAVLPRLSRATEHRFELLWLFTATLSRYEYINK